MNDVYTYPEYGKPDEAFPLAVKAEMRRLLGRLADGSISHMELVCLPSDDTPLQPREIIETALIRLQKSGEIQIADTEPSSNQNLLVTYELADKHTSAS